MTDPIDLTDPAECARLLEIINGPLDVAGSGRYPRRDAMMGALPVALALIGQQQAAERQREQNMGSVCHSRLEARAAELQAENSRLRDRNNRIQSAARDRREARHCAGRISTTLELVTENAALRGRIEELETSNNRLRVQLKIPHPARDLGNEANALLAAKDRESARLREALRKYGRHEISCNLLCSVSKLHPGACDCGWEAVLAAIEKEEKSNVE